jgi:hypothetical protein
MVNFGLHCSGSISWGPYAMWSGGLCTFDEMAVGWSALLAALRRGAGPAGGSARGRCRPLDLHQPQSEPGGRLGAVHLHPARQQLGTGGRYRHQGREHPASGNGDGLSGGRARLGLWQLGGIRRHLYDAQLGGGRERVLLRRSVAPCLAKFTVNDLVNVVWRCSLPFRRGRQSTPAPAPR